MKFAPVPVDLAEGAILAHSVLLPDGRLRKGAGRENVIIAHRGPVMCTKIPPPCGRRSIVIADGGIRKNQVFSNPDPRD
ncbi:hypothetical protein [Oceaniglobus ichthyenteri]|uniref:hypothetical protein n=1 Tax=Oceaniglobus ichthyenteri TaxID=2136177 RepID=UPI000D3B7304|nr:hypothetical protein [Oceaniglobus ichthyenteri]